jgi:hypothetical protein
MPNKSTRQLDHRSRAASKLIVSVDLVSIPTPSKMNRAAGLRAVHYEEVIIHLQIFPLGERHHWPHQDGNRILCREPQQHFLFRLSIVYRRVETYHRLCRSVKIGQALESVCLEAFLKGRLKDIIVSDHQDLGRFIDLHNANDLGAITAHIVISQVAVCI